MSAYKAALVRIWRNQTEWWMEIARQNNNWPTTVVASESYVSPWKLINLTIKYAITVTLKIISATTKVILTTNKPVLVTAEYSDLISNLLPGPFLYWCDAMAGCIGNGIMLNIIQQGFLGILMISSFISWCSKELILWLVSRSGEHHLFIIMLIAINWESLEGTFENITFTNFQVNNALIMPWAS